MTLEENLAGLSMEELADAAYRLGLNLPGRQSRARYTAAITEELRTSPEHLAHALGYSRVRVLNQYFSKHRKRDIRHGQPELDHACASLMEFGLAVWDEQCWHVMPEADILRFITPALERALQRRETTVTRVENWLRLYGALPMREVQQRLHMHSAERLLTIWGSLFGMSGSCSFDRQIWLVHPIIEVPDALLLAVTSDALRDVDYADFTERDAQSAASIGLPEKGRALEFCRSLYAEELVSSGILFMAFALLQKRGMQDAAQLLMTLPKTGSRPQSVEQALVHGCLEQFPQWQYKGHSAAEMTAVHRRKQPRNHTGRPLN